MRTSRWIVLLIAAILLTGCQYEGLLNWMVVRNDGVSVTGATFEGVILPIDKAKSIAHIVGGQRNEAWMPSTTQVTALETRLESYLKQRLRPTNYGYSILAKLPRYKRQYIGIFIRQQQVIYANFLCDSSARNMPWQFDFMFVMDGGDCFFQVKYDVNTATFSGLMINGVA